jgi:hypothetical protein
LLGVNVFQNSDGAIVYYQPGATGWGTTFGSRPTVQVGGSNPQYGQIKERAVAVTQPSEFECTTNGDHLVITKYTGSGGEVVIPSTLNGKGVTSIGDRAFTKCTDVTSVTIPDSVTNIGIKAFARCSKLNNVTLSKSVSHIDTGAFWACSGLTSVTIPDSVTRIGTWTFSSCTKLTKVEFLGDSPVLEGDVFLNANRVTVYYHQGTKGWDTTFGSRPTKVLE